jgi:hypothetical protein
MSQPLELGYQWRTPVVVSTVAMVAFLGLIVRGGANGWPAVALVVVGLWAMFIGVVYLRTRAFVEVAGPVLTVRRYRAFRRIKGAEVTAVRQFLTPHGPSYVLVLDDRGRPARQVVPAALLRRGHATLFTWLDEHAPQAELDRGSRRTREQLRQRGLVG